MALKEYFYFTKEERRGVLALLIIICSIIGVRVCIAAALTTGETSTAPVYKRYVKQQTGPIELNTADTLQLQDLSGIGPGYARRIVQYRNKLGGYYAKEQLLEIYGFTPELYNKIKSHITVDATKIKKLNINKGNIAELKRHPYLSYFEAKAIVEYRESKASGKIESITELKNLKDLKENWEVIKIYITTDEP